MALKKETNKKDYKINLYNLAYITIFARDYTPDVWEEYCEGCGLSTEVKKITIWFDTQRCVEADGEPCDLRKADEEYANKIGGNYDEEKEEICSSRI